MVLTTFHIGSPVALGALLEKLPGPVVVLANTRGLQRAGPERVDLKVGEKDRIVAVKRAVDTLRAGGFVFTVADGDGAERLEANLLGRTITLPRGVFAIARLGNAPILPVAARWRGRGVEIVTGDLIPPAAEQTMAEQLISWLEGYLSKNPEPVPGSIAYMLGLSLADTVGILAQRRKEKPVPDLAVVGTGDGPGRYDNYPAGREADGRHDATRDLSADRLG